MGAAAVTSKLLLVALGWKTATLVSPETAEKHRFSFHQCNSKLFFTNAVFYIILSRRENLLQDIQLCTSEKGFWLGRADLLHLF